MAHYNDATIAELFKEASAKAFQDRLSREYFYDLTEKGGHLEVLGNLQDLDTGFPQNLETERLKDRRDESAAWVHTLIDQDREHEESLPVPESPVKMRRGKGPNARGDYMEEVTYEDGRVEVFLEDPEQMVKMQLQEKSAANEIQGINDGFRDGRQYAEAAAISEGAIAEEFRRLSSAAYEEARSRREAFRQNRLAQFIEAGFSTEEAQRQVTGKDGELPYRLGETAPASGTVAEALELAKAGKFDEVLGLGLDAQQRYQLAGALDAELGDTKANRVMDELTKTNPEQDAQLAREAGRS
jgi:hypothetical protein